MTKPNPTNAQHINKMLGTCDPLGPRTSVPTVPNTLSTNPIHTGNADDLSAQSISSAADGVSGPGVPLDSSTDREDGGNI
jgi:hypothetical protein